MGFEEEVERSFGRPCRQSDGGPSGHAIAPHPSSREGHHSTARWSSSFLLSDLILYGLELKAEGGRISPTQATAYALLWQAGATVETAVGMGRGDSTAPGLEPVALKMPVSTFLRGTRTVPSRALLLWLGHLPFPGSRHVGIDGIYREIGITFGEQDERHSQLGDGGRPIV